MCHLICFMNTTIDSVHFAIKTASKTSNISKVLIAFTMYTHTKVIGTFLPFAMKAHRSQKTGKSWSCFKSIHHFLFTNKQKQNP